MNASSEALSLSFFNGVFAWVVVWSVSRVTYDAFREFLSRRDFVTAMATLGLALIVAGAMISLYRNLILGEPPTFDSIVLHAGLGLWNFLVVQGLIAGTGRASLRPAVRPPTT